MMHFDWNAISAVAAAAGVVVAAVLSLRAVRIAQKTVSVEFRAQLRALTILDSRPGLHAIALLRVIRNSVRVQYLTVVADDAFSSRLGPRGLTHAFTEDILDGADGLAEQTHADIVAWFVAQGMVNRIVRGRCEHRWCAGSSATGSSPDMQ